MTHEETFTFHAKELQSYRQLPQILYHFSVKERDEPRPARGGLIRVREFIMKDSYSFDRDEAGLDVSFEKHRGAYKRIFERCGLEAYDVQAESGMMGGSESRRLPRAGGLRREHARHLRERRLRGRSRGRARRAARAGVPRAARRARGDRDARRDDDRGAGRVPRHRSGGNVEGDAGRQGRRHARARPGPRRRPARGGEDARRARLELPAGDRGRDPRRRSAPTRARSGRSASTARSSPTRRCAKGSSSPARTATGRHLRGVEAGRDFTPRFADLRQSNEGDTCPNCGGALRFQTAIEVGHIFKLGTRYSEPLGATFLDEDGTERPLVMGSYGIGLARVMAAAVEQHHDEHGIVWPEAIAPYDVHVVALSGAEEIAEQAAAAMEERGLQRPPRRPRLAGGGEVRGRGSDRCARARDRGEEEPRGRRGRRARPRDRRRATRAAGRTLMARKRRFSEDPFGPTVERLMTETGVTYRALADKTKPVGRVPQPPRPRQPAGAVERRRRDARRRARRRAGALPRVPPPRDHREARGDARADRPPLQAPGLTVRGRGAAWLARLSGGLEVPSSNLGSRAARLHVTAGKTLTNCELPIAIQIRWRLEEQHLGARSAGAERRRSLPGLGSSRSGRSGVVGAGRYLRHGARVLRKPQGGGRSATVENSRASAAHVSRVQLVARLTLGSAGERCWDHSNRSGERDMSGIQWYERASGTQ